MNALMANGDVQMLAVCDVRGTQRRKAKATVDQKYGNQDCAAYIDLRELLARDDIDAVLIATGDNWHTMAAMLAARAGKDMYCEKPMSVTVVEGRALCDAMERYGVVFQCGTQRRSVPRFAFAVELAQSGKLGELKTLYAEKSPDWFEGYHTRTLPVQPLPPREEVDWDMWLGPAMWRPYNEKYMARNFWRRPPGFRRRTDYRVGKPHRRPLPVGQQRRRLHRRCNTNWPKAQSSPTMRTV